VKHSREREKEWRRGEERRRENAVEEEMNKESGRRVLLGSF